MESISFSIAGCEIRLLMPFRPEVTRGFQPFLCAPGEAPLTVSLLPVQALPEVRGRELLRNYAFAVFRTEDGFFRVFHDRREGDRPYAVGHLEQDGRETIEYLEADRGFFSETANCFSHIALEALLLQREAMILHASFVSTRYGGLLFSGVSGIGKSTQADLWQRYEGAELLNGDRTVLLLQCRRSALHPGDFLPDEKVTKESPRAAPFGIPRCVVAALFALAYASRRATSCHKNRPICHFGVVGKSVLFSSSSSTGVTPSIFNPWLGRDAPEDAAGSILPQPIPLGQGAGESKGVHPLVLGVQGPGGPWRIFAYFLYARK